MEFPKIGKNCSWPSCKTLDFLPFTCHHCNKVFCKEHFNQEFHRCDLLKNVLSKKVTVKSFPCAHHECSSQNLVEMPCPKCNEHFCLTHRYHNCFDVQDNMDEKQKLWNKPREQFAQSLNDVNQIVEENIKKAMKDPKKQATAMKIQLMKLKGRAKGTSTIPLTDRIYFLVLLPKGSKKTSEAIFISKNWSIGKVIDSASTLCSIINKNNEHNSPKLRLFKADGTQVSSDLSSKTFDLIETGEIVNGETLILEYVNPSEDLFNYSLKVLDYKE